MLEEEIETFIVYFVFVFDESEAKNTDSRYIDERD